MSRMLYIFPGQGAQYRGMGSDIADAFPSAGAVYDEAGDVLGYDMRRLSFEDPDHGLTTSRFTQPALLTHSMACLAAFRELRGDAPAPVATAGHSLGEYSALVAAGVLTFADGLRLVQRRGEAFSTYGTGGMMAFRKEAEAIEELVHRHQCGISAINLPQQTVVGGRDSDLEALLADAKEALGTEGTPLNVEGAFHTHLMEEVRKVFATAFEGIPFNKPVCKVLSNATGTYHSDNPEVIRKALLDQIVNPVRWVEDIQTVLADGVDAIIEFGGGLGKTEEPAERRPNLAGIMKRLTKSAGKIPYAGAINMETIRAAAANNDDS